MERLAQFYNPMEAVHWTFWQTLAWVRDRDANTVLECSEPCRWFVGTFREIWREDSFETCRAFASLSRTHQAGTLIVTGIDATSGVRREIRPLEWCDLQFVGIDRAAPELCRRELSTASLATRDEPVFRELRVRREDVLRAFPENAGAIRRSVGFGECRCGRRSVCSARMPSPPKITLFRRMTLRPCCAKRCKEPEVDAG